MQLSSIGFFTFHRNKRRKVCMGEKDITEKILADYNDVFADIVNVLLFGGKTIVDEVLKLMSVLTQDERFEQAQANGNKGGLKNMCEVLDRAEARGISIGEARGELKGAVRAYLDVKVPIEEIAKKLNISVEEVQKIADTL
jgi:hypothetical protein